MVCTVLLSNAFIGCPKKRAFVPKKLSLAPWKGLLHRAKKFYCTSASKNGIFGATFILFTRGSNVNFHIDSVVIPVSFFEISFQ